VDGPGTVRLWLALGVAALAAGCLVIGPLFPVVQPDTEPAYQAWPLLAVLALLAPVIAAISVVRGHSGLAAGVLTGAAAVAVGRAVLDLAIASEAGLGPRPELVVPTTLVPVHSGPGQWVLLIGELLIVLAGFIAAGAVAADDEGGAAFTGDARSPRAARDGRPVAGAFLLAAVAGFGLLVVPFRSDNPYLRGAGVPDRPLISAIGGVLIAVAVPLAAMLAASAADRSVARGGLLGLAVGVAGVAVPSVAAGIFGTALHPSWGPYVALVAAAGLVLIAWRLPDRGLEPADPAEPVEVALPGESRLLRAAGIAAVLAGLLAVVAAFLPLVTSDQQAELPPTEVERLLIPAGVLVAAGGVALLVGRLARIVRPAFVIGWAVLLVACAGVADLAAAVSGLPTARAGIGNTGTWIYAMVGAVPDRDVYATAGVSTVRVGPAVWVALGALVVALVAASYAVLAGVAERDRMGVARRPVLRRRVPLLGLIALGAVGAFGFPVLTGPDFVPTGLWSGLRIGSWGLALALVTVLAGLLISARARLTPALALLGGVAAVLAVRLLELPLTSGRVPGGTAGLGAWFALGCLALVFVAAVMVVLEPAEPTTRRIPARRR
jgi:hypothetical protein